MYYTDVAKESCFFIAHFMLEGSRTYGVYLIQLMGPSAKCLSFSCTKRQTCGQIILSVLMLVSKLPD